MLKKAKAYVTTIPFGSVSDEPLRLLEEAGIECVQNPFGTDISHDTHASFFADADYIIAGLSPFTTHFFDTAKNVKCIARVGVGYDNVPLDECRKRGVKVSFTPEATREPVAEITIGVMIDLLRRFSLVDRDMRRGVWNKHMGGLLQGKVVGIVGLGRIGKRVAELLGPFGVTLLAHDIAEDTLFAEKHHVQYVSKEELLALSDVVTLHLSNSPEVFHYIDETALGRMKSSAVLINFSRGGMVDEEALHHALSDGRIAGAALDVFEKEPYVGPLSELDTVILSAHVGSATVESRRLMEVTAVEEIVRVHKGEPLLFELA